MQATKAMLSLMMLIKVFPLLRLPAALCVQLYFAL
jgi:hypothetical protein